MTDDALPLAGIRVVEIGHSVAAPYAALILAELGAEVIKLERPGHGDDARAWGPPFIDEMSAVFHALNRLKRSVTLDLKSPQGVDKLKRLARVGPDYGCDANVIEDVDAAETVVDGEEPLDCGRDEASSGGIFGDGIIGGVCVGLRDDGAGDGSVVDLEGHPPRHQIVGEHQRLVILTANSPRAAFVFGQSGGVC